MDEMQLLVDLHRGTPRQGPGGDATTRQALALTGIAPASDLAVADIGCGSGVSARVLARDLGARVTAVDLVPAFLEQMVRENAAAGLAARIAPLEASMDALPFAAESLDLIWSEGAIYSMGFAAGVAAWGAFLKPGGVLAVSELTWLTTNRPAALQAFWDDAYAEVDTASAKFAVLERSGYTPIGYLTVPESCWLEGYYQPLAARFDDFLRAHDHSAAAQAVVDEMRAEHALYAAHSGHVGYGFYIARKLGA